VKVGIIGMGFVGGTTAKVLGKAHEIIPYDKYKKEFQDFSKLKEAEVIFICVPTPMRSSGEMDYSAIHNSLEILEKETEKNKTKPLVVIRSTAVSGTTDDLEKKYPFHFVFNPEFLREKNALHDMLNTNRVVIGANRLEDYEKVKTVYKLLFPNAKYIHVNRKTAELIKYAANVFLTGQIALANEIYQICRVLGVDYETVKSTVLEDSRIGRNIDVPGPDGDLGFGGKCFPKDLNALIYLARENMYRPYLLEEIWRLNEKIRKNKDWLEIPGATSENQNFKE
jgi:UDPglucose 6-dehydrogenase